MRVPKYDVARRALRQLEPCVERADQVLRRPDPAPPAAARRSRCRRCALRGRIGQRRQRDRRDAARDEGALLSEREREAEIEQLAERAGRARGPRRSARARGAPRCARAMRTASARVSPAIRRRGRPAPAIASRLITASARSRYGELSAKWAAPRAPKAPPSVETNTSVWLGCVWIGVVPPTERVRPGELDQRGRARRVVVRAGAAAAVVAVRGDDDRPRRRSLDDRARGSGARPRPGRESAPGSGRPDGLGP